MIEQAPSFFAATHAVLCSWCVSVDFVGVNFSEFGRISELSVCAGAGSGAQGGLLPRAGQPQPGDLHGDGRSDGGACALSPVPSPSLLPM
eukprot:876414-Prorocentrum_minimum.AAC.2